MVRLCIATPVVPHNKSEPCCFLCGLMHDIASTTAQGLEGNGVQTFRFLQETGRSLGSELMKDQDPHKPHKQGIL